MLVHDDTAALSLGLYQRHSRFPVIRPEVTLTACKGQIDYSLEETKLDPVNRPPLVAVIHRVVEQMMNLPAASTHHHRTSGGLFYHSLEVAMLAGRTARDEGEDEAMVMACYLAGLLHDLGKIRSLFIVSKYEPAQATAEFGERQPAPLIWDPDQMSLARWCAENDVRHLGLKYQSTSKLGHGMFTRMLWREVVSEALLDHIAALPETPACREGSPICVSLFPSRRVKMRAPS